MYSEKLPSAYSDDELQEAFWSINRDRFPERYELICAEMDARNIEYEDLPQWQRNQRNLDAEVEAAELVRDTISDSARLGFAAKVSLFEFFVQTIKVAIRRLTKNAWK